MWRPGKSHYERVVEDALRILGASFPICRGYHWNCATHFSGRMRYDFILGDDRHCSYLIEVQGEQHYSSRHDNRNDELKKHLAFIYNSPLLVIPYWRAYYVSEELLELTGSFVALETEHDKVKIETDTGVGSPKTFEEIFALLKSVDVVHESIRQYVQQLSPATKRELLPFLPRWVREELSAQL